MKALGITLIIIVLAMHASAGTRDTVATRVRWTRNLPAAVRTGWKNCKYAGWHIFGIKRLVTQDDTLYTIHVALYQSLGPDDADIAEEDLIYFSATGQLLKVRRL